MVDLNTRMNPDVVGRTSLPVPTTVFKCITDSGYYSPGNEYPRADTNSGQCNIFDCNCDHCYGDSNCGGTNDGDSAGVAERAALVWNAVPGRGIFSVPCPEAAPYLACPVGSGLAAASGSVGPCADKDLLLREPLNATIARLSGKFCASGNVGPSFAGQVLDSLDADNSGAVDCAEWSIAKQRATIQSLGGGYFGPKQIKPPVCKMSDAGAKELASYNAYLARLTLATLKANATGLVAESVTSAVHMIDGTVRSNAFVGEAVDAAAKLSAELNKVINR